MKNLSYIFQSKATSGKGIARMKKSRKPFDVHAIVKGTNSNSSLLSLHFSLLYDSLLSPFPDGTLIGEEGRGTEDGKKIINISHRVLVSEKKTVSLRFG